MCARHKQGSNPSGGDREVALRVGTEHTEVQQHQKMAGDTWDKARLIFFLKVRDGCALRTKAVTRSKQGTFSELN